jgi:hypothetical protein
MTMLIIPILPNKEEAWRRFLQALQGSQSRPFKAWCRRLALEVQQVWLSEGPGGAAVVVVRLAIENSDVALARLADLPSPFDRWLRLQILALHGLDVAKVARAAGSSTSSFISPEVTDIRR